MTPIEQLHAALSALPDVSEGRSRFGSRRNLAWSVAGREFAHLHSNDVLDLRLPRAAQGRLRADPRARFRSAASEWLEFEFHTSQDAAFLATLAYQAWVAARKAR